jgi:Ni/Co efflux regulator RcnB
VFHFGFYHRPHGWYYRQWGYGEYLPPLFWVHDYWLDNYAQFGLDVPPDGYEWVRYGSDALLIDTTTGQVVNAQYGVFD